MTPAQQSKTLSANDASSEDEAGRVFDCRLEFAGELVAFLTAISLATANNRVPQSGPTTEMNESPF